ncbi:MAG: oxidoreductase [Planctomycetaceae bacterium]|nr:MAG: oxidoreductase [Planctomycetaceae bacterium]
MHDFEYVAPTTLAQALEWMARGNGKVRALAGGTDLIDHLRLGRWQPELLVDIKKIPELQRLTVSPQGLHLGAAVPCARITAHPDIARDYSALADSCRIIGGIQIQHRASVGGNLCNAGPAADSTPSVIALRGSCVIASTAGTRTVAAEQFCTAPGQNVLRSGELLVELQFPPPEPLSGSHYRRFIPRNEMDIAVVGVAAWLVLEPDRETIRTCRIALGAVAPTPLLAADAAQELVGRTLHDQTALRHACESAQAQARPISDHRGSAEYRRHLIGVLLPRVLQTARSRARGEPVCYRPGHS